MIELKTGKRIHFISVWQKRSALLVVARGISQLGKLMDRLRETQKDDLDSLKHAQFTASESSDQEPEPMSMITSFEIDRAIDLLEIAEYILNDAINRCAKIVTQEDVDDEINPLDADPVVRAIRKINKTLKDPEDIREKYHQLFVAHGVALSKELEASNEKQN